MEWRGVAPSVFQVGTTSDDITNWDMDDWEGIQWDGRRYVGIFEAEEVLSQFVAFLIIEGVLEDFEKRKATCDRRPLENDWLP